MRRRTIKILFEYRGRLRMATPIFMYFVYILRSIGLPKQIYTGSTENLKQRIKSHNEGSNKHTSKFRPWKIIWFCAFPIKKQAEEFEKYLKSSSGIAFKRKRLINN